MKKSILALTFLLFTGIAFSQTTVTLQDQCNCEVLKGTDVSTSGAVTPTGADLGDIYVNTNTGTIYFWDGDSWELTATDDQQLTGFNFDGVTNTLSLTLENGGTVNVDLSSLSDVFTDTNTTIASFGIDGTNTNLVITDSEANTFAVALVDLAALINTDNQTLTEVLSQGNDAGGATITNLAVPVNPQDAATKAYVDSVADDDITGVSFDGGTNEVTVSEGGTSFSADLSSLDDSAGVAANAADIANNTTAIGNNATDISNNATNISNNTTAIGNNASNITANASDIANNTTNISNNASAIATNASDIANNTTAIGNNATDISNNATNISNNTTAIGNNATNITANASDIANNTTNISNNASAIATNTSDIANNTTAIGNNASNITTNASDIANNTTNISNNASAIATNTSDIANNTTNISNNASAIATNTSDIANNTTNISNNATNISNNTTAIGNNASNITTNASDIANNTTNISNNTSAIATNTTDIATNATNLANHISADGDLSDTNEIQNIEEVLTDGNDANGLVLTGLGAPTAGSDAATKAYVDSVADDDITGVSFDGGTNEVTVSEGGTSFSADLSSLDDSAGVAANAADIANNTTAIGNNASNISTNTTNISNNASAIATNTSDIANNTTNISNNASAIATNTSDIANNTAAIGNNAANITTNASDIANNTTAIGNNATDIANHIAADADTNIGNEYNTGSSITDGVIGITDGGGTESIDLISSDLNNNITFGSDGALYLNVASVSIAETNTSLSYNDATGELTYSNELGNNPVVDISGLDDSAGVAANAADIANNTTAIGNNATNITANATDIATNATNLANHISADGDLSDTNEIQNIEEVLTDGNDANGLVLTGLGAPTAGSDAATKAYVDSVADDDITGVSFDGGTNEVTVSEGGTSFSADLSSLDDSAGVAANAADIANNTTAIGNNAADIANNTTNISNNTSAIATNASDIANNATNLANHISADGDLSDTNEIQNIEEVLTDGNDANGLVLTGLGAPTAGSDAATKAYVDSVADDDITGVSFDGGTNEVTVSEGGTSFSADLSSLDDSAGVAANAADIANNTTAIGNNAADIANNTTAIGNNASDISNNATNITTNATNISNNTTAIGNNATDIANNTTAISNNATDIANHIAADADTNIGNEYNTGSSITDGVIGITDGGGTESIDLISSDLNNNITFGSDGALYLNVASVSIAETNTSLSYNDATGELTYSNELGNNPVVDISGLDDSAGVAANASDISNNTTAIGNNASNITTNASDIANNTTNISNNASAIATNTTDIATNATNLANHISADGDLSDTNEIQNIEEVLTDGNDANGLVLTGLGAPTAASDAATKAYVDSVADDDITGVSFDGGTNEVTVSEGGTSFSADLSSLDDSAGVAANAADIANNTTAIGNNAADIANNTTNISNNAGAIATNTTDIAANATNLANHISADGDLSDTNEIQNIEEVLTDGNDANGLVLTGLGAPTAASDAATKAYVDSVADDDITGVSFDGGTNEVTVSEGGTSFSADLSSLDDSAGVAANAADIANNTTAIGNNASDISNNATNISNNTTAIGNNATNITANATDIATNATNLANHISADGDLSDTNEINTRFEVNGANLEIEDSNGTLQVPLADINNQDASEVNSDSPVDVDGDGNTESTVEDVIQDIARITSKAARIFYPPSIAIDASTNGTGRTINLYSQYLAQYGSPTVRSAGAPAAIPTYGATELYYYVTYADPTVFANMTIDANGVLTYDIIGQPADYNALINVVFVVK